MFGVGGGQRVALECWLVRWRFLLVVLSIAGADNSINFGGSAQLILGFGTPKILSLLLTRPELPSQRAQKKCYCCARFGIWEAFCG